MSKAGLLFCLFALAVGASAQVLSVVPASAFTNAPIPVVVSLKNNGTDVAFNGTVVSVTLNTFACNITSLAPVTCTTAFNTTTGKGDVVVTTAKQVYTLVGGFTYLAPTPAPTPSPTPSPTPAPTPAPVPNTISPVTSPLNVPVKLTITLSAAVTSTDLSVSFTTSSNVTSPCTYVTVDATKMIITAVSPVAAAAGTATVVVKTNADGKVVATFTNAWTYTASVNGPYISGVSRNWATYTQKAVITVVGGAFNTFTTVTLNFLPVTFTVDASSTTFTATAPVCAPTNVTACGGVGNWVFTNGNVTVLTVANAFTYVPVPVVTALSVASTPFNIAAAVTVTGTDLVLAAVGVVTVSLAGVPATGLVQTSATSYSLTSATTTSVKSGAVTISDNYGQVISTSTVQFSYTAAVYAPVVTSVAPIRARFDTPTPVVISGSYFKFFSVSQVLLAGQQATNVVATDSQVTLNTPVFNVANATGDIVLIGGAFANVTLVTIPNGFTSYLPVAIDVVFKLKLDLAQTSVDAVTKAVTSSVTAALFNNVTTPFFTVKSVVPGSILVTSQFVQNNQFDAVGAASGFISQFTNPNSTLNTNAAFIALAPDTSSVPTSSTVPVCSDGTYQVVCAAEPSKTDVALIAGAVAGAVAGVALIFAIWYFCCRQPSDLDTLITKSDLGSSYGNKYGELSGH